MAKDFSKIDRSIPIYEVRQHKKFHRLVTNSKQEAIELAEKLGNCEVEESICDNTKEVLEHTIFLVAHPIVIFSN